MGYNHLMVALASKKGTKNQASWREDYIFSWKSLRRNLHVATKRVYRTKEGTQILPSPKGSLWSEVNIKGMVHQDWHFFMYSWSNPKWVRPQSIFSMEGGHYVIIILYVDDLFLIGDVTKWLNILEEELTKRYEMTNMGFMNLYIRI